MPNLADIRGLISSPPMRAAFGMMMLMAGMTVINRASQDQVDRISTLEDLALKAETRMKDAQRRETASAEARWMANNTAEARTVGEQDETPAEMAPAPA